MCGALFALLFCAICASAQDKTQIVASEKTTNPSENASKKEAKTEVATFGGGCFWCVEAVFENVKGVSDVVSGYEGGRTRNPSYKQVCSGVTGHAEVCQITYDPEQVSFAELLEIFWKTHDPTTLNQQGADYGTQYRSVVFYHNDEQKEVAEKYKKKLDEAGAFDNKIVTEITRTRKFYVAEDYHQDYYRLNPGAGYCANVVRPKVEKFKKAFADKFEPPK
ncbi:MAG: peptide-methionine (S)-S-oxide reductase MsrA [Pirellulaceae bacterium]